MDHIEIHTIQEFPIHCMNRDMDGTPKSVNINDSLRGMISSQALKRAWRTVCKEEMPEYFGGNRTKYITREVAKAIADVVPEEEMPYFQRICTDGIKGSHKDDINKLSTIVFVSNQEMANIADILRAHKEDIGKVQACDIKTSQEFTKEKYKKLTYKTDPDKRSEAIKAITQATDTICKDMSDIYLFGRMIAGRDNIESAVKSSSAFTTHRTVPSINAFIAAEEMHEKDDAGAAHMDYQETNTGCYYMFKSINLDQLRSENNIGGVLDDEEFRGVLKCALVCSIMAAPSGMSTSYFASTYPAYILMIRKNGYPKTFGDQFLTPVELGKNCLEESIKRVSDKWNEAKEKFCINPKFECTTGMKGDTKIDAAVAGILEGI